MNEASSLQSRLDDIETRISDVRRKLEQKHIFDKGHQATEVEMRERHAALQQQLREEIADLESHGRHVGNLERALLEWINHVGG